MITRKHYIQALVCLLLFGCASTDWESPNVNLVGIKYMGGKMFEQRFLVTLNVQNPNNRALPIEGVTVNLEIEGQDVAEGVNRSDKEIPPFGDDEVNLILTTNLFKGARVVLELMKSQQPTFDYAVSGSMHTGGALSVKVPFSSEGTLDISNLTN